MAYYPTVTMVLWAFLTIYLTPTTSFLQDAPGFFIGAVLLWDVLFRGQLGVSLTFIEEMYSRNLGNLFVSPLRLREFIAGQLAMSVLRTLIGVGGACVFAWLLFRYSIFSLGFPLIAFFVLLIAFGWGDRAGGVGDDPALGPGRRRARVGRDLPGGAGVGRLLPDRRAAGWLQVDRLDRCRRRTCSKACARCCSQGVFRWDHFWWAPGARRRLSRRRAPRVPLSRSTMRASTARCCRWASEAASSRRR